MLWVPIAGTIWEKRRHGKPTFCQQKRKIGKKKEKISTVAHDIHIVGCRTNTTWAPPRVASVEKILALFNANPAPTVKKLEKMFNQRRHGGIFSLNKWIHTFVSKVGSKSIWEFPSRSYQDEDGVSSYIKCQTCGAVRSGRNNHILGPGRFIRIGLHCPQVQAPLESRDK